MQPWDRRKKKKIKKTGKKERKRKIHFHRNARELAREDRRNWLLVRVIYSTRLIHVVAGCTIAPGTAVYVCARVCFVGNVEKWRSQSRKAVYPTFPMKLDIEQVLVSLSIFPLFTRLVHISFVFHRWRTLTILVYRPSSLSLSLSLSFFYFSIVRIRFED